MTFFILTMLSLCLGNWIACRRDDHHHLATFLILLHDKGVNWLLLDYDMPQLYQLYRRSDSDFQICQFWEINKGREMTFLFIFNCYIIQACQAMKQQVLLPLH